MKIIYLIAAVFFTFLFKGQVFSQCTATIAGDTAVCEGGDSLLITFTGSNGTAPYTFIYNINGGSDTSVTTTGSDSTITIAAPADSAGIFFYNLDSVADITGCLQPQTGSVTITVYALPAALISGTTNVCQNEVSPLIIFTGADGLQNYNFSYHINSGLNNTVTTNSSDTVSVTVPTGIPGVFIYHLDSVSDEHGCYRALQDSATVIVDSLPIAVLSGNQTVCQNNPTAITFNGSNGTPPFTFKYFIDGIQNTIISSGNSISVPVATNNPGIYVYLLDSVFNSNGCSQKQADTATITVHPLPSAAISGTITICRDSGATTPITFTGSNGTPPYTFYYNINSGPPLVISTSGNNSVKIKNASIGAGGTFVYNLDSVSDANGCLQVITGSATITVNFLPIGTINGNATVCQNDSSPLITFSGYNGTSPFIFYYHINNGPPLNIATSGSNTVTVAVPTNNPGIFVYHLDSVSNSNNCFKTLGSDSLTITVNPLPTGSITGDTAVCQNAPSPSLTFTGYDGAPPYTFTYNVNAGTNQTITTNSNDSIAVSVATNTPGTFVYNLISVSDSNGCSQAVTGSDTIIVHTLPTATITGDTTVCSSPDSIPVIFTGSNGTAPYTFFYNLNGIPQPPLTSSGIDTINAPTDSAGTFVYTLNSVSDTNGCMQIINGSVTIVVNQSLIAMITVQDNSGNSPDDGIICSGDSAILIASGGLTYLWSTGDSTTAITVGATGSYSVTVSLNDSICTSTASVAITVNPLPTATIISGNDTVCSSPDSIPVIFTGSNGTAPYTFIYSINGVSQPDLNASVNDTTIYAPTDSAETFVYTLNSVSDINGCMQTINSSVTIVVNQSLSAMITVQDDSGNSPDDGIICSGDSAILIASGGLTYLWSTGDSTAAITVGTAMTYSVTVSLNGNCTSTASVTITVNPLPTATITGDTTVCSSPDSIPVIFTGSNGTAPYTFIYSINGVPQDTLVSSGIYTIYAPTDTVGIFVYTLISVSDANGCLQAITTSATITVYPAPETPVFTALTQGTEISLCRGSANINFNVTNPSNTVTYLWNVSNTGAASIGNVTNPNTVISFYDEGQITIWNTNSTGLGCQGTSSMSVTVNNNDGFEERKIILKQPGNLLVYPDNSMDPSHYFGNVLINGYQWGYDSIADKASPLDSLGPPTEIPGQVYQVFVPVSKFINGNSLNETDYAYWVLLNKDGCQSRVYYNGPYKNNRLLPEIPVDNTVGASVFPNPTTGDLNIMLHGNIYGNIDVSICNPLGQIVYKDNFEKKQFETIQNIKLNKIPEGIYLLELLSSDHQQVTARIIIYH
ncbi:MAG TPA: T9SS type A sorting domain-containing protein [Bacteroidia bacterium]|nr:T9SS type A sorting domain-containing protein [Bacteroidia bacterium]